MLILLDSPYGILWELQHFRWLVDLLILLVVMGVLTLISLPLAFALVPIFMQGLRIGFDDNGITQKIIWWKKFIPWSEISAVKQTRHISRNGASGIVIISQKKNRRIIIPPFFDIPAITNVMEQHNHPVSHESIRHW